MHRSSFICFILVTSNCTFNNFSWSSCMMRKKSVRSAADEIFMSKADQVQRRFQTIFQNFDLNYTQKCRLRSSGFHWDLVHRMLPPVMLFYCWSKILYNTTTNPSFTSSTFQVKIFISKLSAKVIIFTSVPN